VVPAHLQIAVLGPLAARAGEQPVALGGPRQRSVLALLVLSAGRPVPTDRIVDDLWGDDAPRTAHRTVHSYVARLRHEFGAAASTLHRIDHGYQLDLAGDDLDAARFEALVERARQESEAGDHAAARADAEAAFDLWRGAPYADLADSPFLAAEVARLDHVRLDAVELLAQACLALDRPGDALPLLEHLVRQHPLREHLTALLMQALYATGRQADALRAFERCRRRLAADLGVDPSSELRDLHEAVLAQRRQLRIPAPRPASDASPRPAVANLPPRNRSFSGRDPLLAQIDRGLRESPDVARLVPAVALHGLGGVGKTQLALEYAHRRVAAGSTVWWIPADDPVTVSAGLVALARRLGLGEGADEQQSLHVLFVDLRRRPDWLLVFDNADSPEQVEEYLPFAGPGHVLVTSRNPAWGRLASTLAVPVFTRTESTTFLQARTRSTGAEREARTLGALADVVGDLPLALEQASAYVESTGMDVNDYVAIFTRRRPALAGRGRPDGDAHRLDTTWRLAFEGVSESPGAADFLLLCAHLAPESIPVGLLAPHLPLRSADPDDDPALAVADAVGQLLRYSLVDRDERGLRMHRLVQGAARDRSPRIERIACLRTAVDVLAAVAPSTPDDPRTWPVWERLPAHVLAVAGHAEALGVRSPTLTGLLRSTARYLTSRASYPAAIRTLELALRLVPDVGVRARIDAELLTDLGTVLDASGDVRAAVEAHRRALATLEADGDVPPLQIGRALARLGRALHCAGSGAVAVDELARALAILDEHGTPGETVLVLTDLGYAQWAAHELSASEESFCRALAAAESGGTADGPAAALALSGLGMVRQDRGDLEGALQLQTRVLATFEAVFGPTHPWVGETLDKIGYTLQLLGRLDESVAMSQRAVATLEQVFGVDDPRVGMALTNQGLALHLAGSLEEARAAQERALQMLLTAYDDGHVHVQLARRRLAAVLLDLDDPERAAALLETALVNEERALGPQHPDVGRTLVRLAIARLRAGDVRGGSALARRARAVVVSSLGADDPEARSLVAELGTS
jgi:DNA-binding SARP family transcriptional activator